MSQCNKTLPTMCTYPLPTSRHEHDQALGVVKAWEQGYIPSFSNFRHTNCRITAML